MWLELYKATGYEEEMVPVYKRQRKRQYKDKWLTRDWQGSIKAHKGLLNRAEKARQTEELPPCKNYRLLDNEHTGVTMLEVMQEKGREHFNKTKTIWVKYRPKDTLATMSWMQHVRCWRCSDYKAVSKWAWNGGQDLAERRHHGFLCVKNRA